MILIQEFKDKEAAKVFDELVKKENLEDQIKKSGIFYDFIITKDNFDILYNTKELDSYLTFYRKNY